MAHVFALPHLSLFPITTPELTKLSAEAVAPHLHRLDLKDQLSAMRKIASAAKEQGVDTPTTRRFAQVLGDTVSSTFKTAMSLRDRVCSSPEAAKDLKGIKLVGEKIASIEGNTADVIRKRDLCDILVEKIASFDQSYGQNAGLPGAVETVFICLEDGMPKTAGEELFVDHEIVEGKIITADTLAKFPVAAAENVLTPETIAKTASLAAFRTCDADEKTLILSFLTV